jgi:hypothetical protein
MRRLVLPALMAGLLVGALLPQTASAQHRFPGHGQGAHRYGGGWGWWGYGGVIGVLPALATVLTIGTVTYWLAEGQYYRAVPSGGYVMVAPPESAEPVAAGRERLYIYPRNAQSAEKQASDEYDCHRWAVGQTGFDPVGSAMGDGAGPSRGQYRDYSRAQSACLDARGYTVR